ncbi:MAG: glycosyl hydrolase family 2 [Faecalibacterium sp. CAG:74_58_120]|nr:MAG: glycosyl hydrolase family 2 [Faecalibacterium sp. CAG:74_58_120]
MHHGWSYWNRETPEQKQAVTLPHDAMLREKRNDANPGGVNVSWFAGGDYVYERMLRFPEDLPGYIAGDQVVIEFEGVYHHAKVLLNGKQVAERPSGYFGIYADLTEALCPGENTLTVLANNREQPNSRWYTGSGIYRPVTVHLLPQKHVLLNGIRVTTLDINQPTVQLQVDTNTGGELHVEMLADGGDQVLYSAQAQTNGKAVITLPMPGAKLWSPDNPNLYRCRVRFEDDAAETTFGVRNIQCDVQHGLRINGQRVLLRGACIHHDNGLIGAVSHPFAEERKVRLLKQAGYNALRIAHNPCAKSLLDACDRLGMLVVDEYLDMWYIHKTKYDYADYFDAWHNRDLSDLVEKDYNHPCVVMYSIGNEVAETSQPKGIALTEEMTNTLHRLDSTRPVTCGVNIFFNFLYSMGFGVYSDKKADDSAQAPAKKKAVGSEFFNNLAGLLGAGFMKFGATLHGSNVKTRDAYAKLDVAGYNYGINRYLHDFMQYPDRVIVGSETFVSDAYRFMQIAKEHPALIGDFVWAGMDYLGEAGIGAWEYPEYARSFEHDARWLTAGTGVLDITGHGDGQMLYTQVAFGLKPIALAVRPVHRTKQQHSPAAWRFTDARATWSWNGCEGCEAAVEVYTEAPRVALYLNGVKIAEKKRPAKDCRVLFSVPWQPGTLEARALDESGKVLHIASLTSAGNETRLTLSPEKETIAPNGLAYVHVQYTDDQGSVKPLVRGKVTLTVEGGTLLGFGHACAYNEDGYLNTFSDTYYGEAMAVIAPAGNTEIRLSAASEAGKNQLRIAVQ